jgi:hypothetical protein
VIRINRDRQVSAGRHRFARVVPQVPQHLRAGAELSASIGARRARARNQLDRGTDERAQAGMADSTTAPRSCTSATAAAVGPNDESWSVSVLRGARRR